MRSLSIATAIAALGALLAGCHGAGSYNPPVTGIHHMYVSSHNSGDVYEYTLPITSTSTASVTLSTGLTAAGMLFVDSNNRLYVPDFSLGASIVNVYSLPLTSASTTAFVLTTAQSTAEDVAEDASGNIYVADADAGGYIDEFAGPVDSSRSPSYTISNNAVGGTGLEFPYGIVFASNGDLYASDTNDINQFTPTLSSGSIPSASVTPNQNNFGIRADSSGRVFVANASANGVINVYVTPMTNVSTPAFNLNVSSADILGIAFDGSGNLWAVDSNETLWKIPAPITSSSTATSVLTTLPSDAYGIAFGP